MGMTAHDNGLVICGSTRGAVRLFLIGKPASKHMHGYNVPYFWDTATLGTESGGCEHSGLSNLKMDYWTVLIFCFTLRECFI
jgi:hypothetical protein